MQYPDGDLRPIVRADVVYDWDSLIADSEPVIAGLAAAPLMTVNRRG